MPYISYTTGNKSCCLHGKNNLIFVSITFGFHFISYYLRGKSFINLHSLFEFIIRRNSIRKFIMWHLQQRPNFCNVKTFFSLFYTHQSFHVISLFKNKLFDWIFIAWKNPWVLKITGLDHGWPTQIIYQALYKIIYSHLL